MHSVVIFVEAMSDDKKLSVNFQMGMHLEVSCDEASFCISPDNHFYSLGPSRMTRNQQLLAMPTLLEAISDDKKPCINF
jgi:hypothetical protein